MGGVAGEGVHQHYALQEEWQRLFASRVRRWAVSAGHVSTDASREAIDRAVSEALHERGVARGASPSSVKKWRTGRFAPPPAELLAVLESLIGTGSELSDLLASITPHVPGTSPPTGPDGDRRPDAGLGANDASGRGDDRPPAGHGPDASVRRRRVLAVSAVLTAIVLVVVALLFNRRSSDPDAGEIASDREADGSCAVAVGSLPAELSSRPNAAEWKAAFSTVYREAGGRAEVGCPTAPVERWEQLLVQVLPGPGGDVSGALVVLANGPSQRFYFNAALWASYYLVGGKGGSRAQTVGGTPQAVTPFPDGHVEVELSAGVLLVAERVDAPYFYIPARYVEWWRVNKGQLGLPMSNPVPGIGQQHTEHGFATVDRNVPGAEPQMHLTESGPADLPAAVGQGGVIITEADDTSWWIPTAGRRQWIADMGTWSCLGGRSKTVGEAVPGAAVATLEYDGIAMCEG
jgi:hypothetical protein